METVVARDEIEYRGETAPRRLSIAIALNLFMPGLGHIYCGQLLGGLAVFAATVIAAAGFFAVVWGSNLFALRAAGVGFAAWAYIQTTMALRLAAWIRRHGQNYLLRPFNAPVVYLGLFVALVVLPALFLGPALIQRSVVAFDVAGRNEFPMLLHGDQVYGVRRSGRDDPIARGELVVVSGLASTPAALRVVGLPGDTVSMERGEVVVNGVPRLRELIGRISSSGEDVSPASVESLRAYRETANGRTYTIYVPDDVEPLFVPPVQLGDEQYFLLADLRGVEKVLDSRRAGPVSGEAILGWPRWVWWSRDPVDDRVRWRRIGLEVR